MVLLFAVIFCSVLAAVTVALGVFTQKARPFLLVLGIIWFLGMCLAVWTSGYGLGWQTLVAVVGSVVVSLLIATERRFDNLIVPTQILGALAFVGALYLARRQFGF
jgi:hypothetical protein